MATLEINRTQQYLTFNLDDEVFALDISQVREVLDFAPVTKVPQTPHFMRGVINLRGNVVPVVDLRAKFGMSPMVDTENICIIIVEVEMDGETTILGALADSVKEVIDLDPTQIEPAPRIGTRLKSGFVRGMGKHDERLLIILDIYKVFFLDELAQVQNSSDDFTAEPALAVAASV